MEVRDFDAIRISLASPDQIDEWSFGEVTKPETINYRTLRPERDGLFCERIFGPQKDWECACGKYKRVRYKGIVCDKCGVEVAPQRVRRERMGHIQLASPVSHIWYVKGVPSHLGLLLNISPRHLERVLYFAQFIITDVNEDARGRAIQRLERELQMGIARLENESQEQIDDIEGSAQSQLDELDAEEQAQIARLDERINRSSSETISQAQRLQDWIQINLGKKAPEDKSLDWVDDPIIAAKKTVTADHERTVNDHVQERLDTLQSESDEEKSDIRTQIQAKQTYIRQELEGLLEKMREDVAEQRERLQSGAEEELDELKSMHEMQLLTETRYRELADRWGNIFKAGMGAEAIRDIVAKVDLDALAKELRLEIFTTKSKQRRKKAAKRLRVVENFRKSGNRPEWMVLTILPVIPPELRPMVQLDGGRFATSDLNDLYRRVINRNNRLKRLLDLGAPDVIVRNEKRMLQEAVDSLIDNGRRGRAVSRSGKRKLKSLSDMLKGKQGRFRRNLLGKRVDYSGRSVIVIGPTLKLHQCGLPKKMALELFKPFVMRRLVEDNYAHNIKSAKRMVDRQQSEVWDELEEICKERPVLLNRAPTLHRLGIQAFEVTLVEGSAIQLHPLVCDAFNADFDGDQMAVHVPLSQSAVDEARQLMLSSQNLLKPSSGEPIVGPSKDMVMGVYYLTIEENESTPDEELPLFSSMDEAEYIYSLGHVKLRDSIRARFTTRFDVQPIESMEVSERVMDALQEYGIATVGALMDIYAQGERHMIQEIPAFGLAAMNEVRDALRKLNLLGAAWPQDRIIRTTIGRIIFNRALPEELWFVNDLLDKKGVNEVIDLCYKHLGREVTAETVDNIKDLGFEYATRSGITIAVSDIQVPHEKDEIIERTSDEVAEAERQYRRGLITEEELYEKTVELWTRAADEVTAEVRKLLSPLEGLGAMAHSGSTKGGVNTVRQLAGMRGLIAGPNGRIIPLPIRSNFREGLTALEYFLSTHGGRKGLADTALRTADAGYLTRRLVDVAQDVIVTEDDCGTNAGIWIDAGSSRVMGESFADRVATRTLAAAIIPPDADEPLLERDTVIDEAALATIERHEVERAFVYSPLTCESRFGLCKKCYGTDLARGGTVEQGEAVGIIAAQSIGEPGTQLTLRTFHTGGVAGSDDITQGLPRVEELFEVRNPKGEAVISEIDGKVDIWWEGDQRMLKVSRTELKRREVAIPEGYELMVDSDDRVQEDTVIARNGDEDAQGLLAGMEGQIFAENGQVIIRREDNLVWETDIPANARLRVEKGEEVSAGEQLTEGSKNPREILRIQGREACQLYLLEQVQQVYRSQGVAIHDKHIEVILRQLLRRVMIRATGDTDFLPGELVDRFQFEDENNKTIGRGHRPAKAEPVVLGLTKAALNTESFLAAASFQETTRVLTDAAVQGQRDELRGLKENVIIGKLIPVGSGFRTRRMWEEEKQQVVEQLAQQHEVADEGLSELEFDLDDPDLDLADLSGLAEMGIGPLGGMLSGFGGNVEEEELDFDFNSLKDEDSEEINVDLR